MGNLHGKVAIITGAASGVGKKLALLFAKQGGSVVAADFREDLLAEVVNKNLHDFGWTSIGVKLDLVSKDDWKTVVQLAFSNFRNFDVLINAAEIPGGEASSGTNPDAYNETMKKIVRGNALGVYAVSPFFKEDGNRLIINMMTVEGSAGGQGNDVYTFLKDSGQLIPDESAANLAKQRVDLYSILPESGSEEPGRGSAVTYAELPDAIIRLIVGG
jgi:NADP-dependent 3-hydroxy acid dehydrogenase YdfG